jgi:eukaryotic-like serine/threonine-protein kinase
MEKETDSPPWTLGRYILIKTLGKGGMGEVFLAFDPLCCRYLALKKIRDELLDKPNIHERFLKEARIASQLTHPSIITIFSIHSDPSLSYYTMPYVEGRTLKEILQTSKEKTKNNKPLSQDESPPALLHVFRKLCEAIAYTHSKGILHRDLKPDNVIVGKFGEVLLLDWGIATSIDTKEKEEEVEDSSSEPLTKPGKIAGTVTYLAPERAFGALSSIQTDIYALGVMLYQILTLSSPFRRTTLSDLRKKAPLEKLVDPRERAPQRDIPQQLSDIALKALAFSLEERYQKVDDLLSDLGRYFEGLSSWIYHADLHLQNKEDWQFHENILLAKHTALTKQPELAEWASLQVSKASFTGNIKIEAEIQLKEGGKGVGFLLDIPEKEQRNRIDEGYCLWCSSSNSFLLRSQVSVKEIPELCLSFQKKHHLCIERIHNQIRIFFDGALISTYASLLPMSGRHVGILYKDTEFSLKSLRISSGRQPLHINCLAIPDAFFTKGHWEIALEEYRHIARSFSGRAEAREAIFRAGLSLLENAKQMSSPKKRSLLFQQALEEFEPLHSTVGAPLEYLGKSMVYASMKESEEEAKCLELSLRKFAKHPSLPLLQEQVIFRSFESSLKERKTAYRLILIGVQHIPQFLESRETKKLLEILQNHWEWPLSQEVLSVDKLLQKDFLTIYLSFHLAKKETLCELIEGWLSSHSNEEVIEEALFALLELGFTKDLASLMPNILSRFPNYNWSSIMQLFQWHFSPKKAPLAHSLQKLTQEKKGLRTLLHIIQHCLTLHRSDLLTSFFKDLPPSLYSQNPLLFDSFHLWYLLLERDFQKAKEILDTYPTSALNDEKNPLHFLYVIYLHSTEGTKIAEAHFSSILETPYPSSSSLLSHYLLKRISLKTWGKEAFFWEKRALFRQLSLFYHCAKNEKQASHYRKLSLLPASAC